MPEQEAVPLSAPTEPQARPVRPPDGHGITKLSLTDLSARDSTDANGFLYGILHQWEPPRRRPRHRAHRYVLGVDTSDGVGRDCSVCSVIRVGTVEEPEEEVAQFVSPHYPAIQFAYVIQAIGEAYQDSNGYEALAAIEIDYNGRSVQDHLQGHLGYTNFYVWEKDDERKPKRRFSTKIGWETNRRSRPKLLDLFYNGVTTLDPITHSPDLVINSPATLSDMRDFQTLGLLGEAEAAGGGRDDCLMATAIGHYVAWHLYFGEQELVADRRRRRSEQREKERLAKFHGGAYDFRNMPFTADELSFHEASGASGEPPPDPDQGLTDERAGDLDEEGGVWSAQDLL